MLQNRLGKELLIFDGAMGTQLQNAGLSAGDIPEELNIDRPDLLRSIHKNYLKAGADFITTNTFGCNRLKMEEAKYEAKDMLLGGALGAFITYTVIYSINAIGPARSAMFIVSVQIVMSYLIELFGLFGIDKQPFEWRKCIGVAAIVAGIAIFKWK